MNDLTAAEGRIVVEQGWNASSLIQVLASWDPSKGSRLDHFKAVAAAENGTEDEPPWSLVDFWDSAEGSEGVTATVEIPGYEQLVRIEHWYTRNSAGVDVYDDAGNEVSVAVEEHLGEQAYEYLTGDWLYEVERAYFDALNPAKEAAVQVARQVPIEIPGGASS